MSVSLKYFWILCAASLIYGCQSKQTPSVNVAVATNFYTVALELEKQFETQSAVDISIASGSTGQLYAQIINGAPHDIFLAADQIRPKKLIEDGFAQDHFTYALGQLVLWGATQETPNLAMLTKTDYRHLAIANPMLAPYGLAAQDVISDLNLSDKVVMGENIGQTYSLIETGNAEFGFISLSQIIAKDNQGSGEYWIVPDELYTPITQDAVLLKSGADNPAAQAFYEFLKSETARDIIKEAGYKLPDGT